MAVRMDVYGGALRNVLFPAWEFVRGRPTPALLHYLLQMERASRDELDALRCGLLRRLTRHAAGHTAFYGERFAALDIDPHDIRTVDDLGRLPVLERDQAVASLDSRTADMPAVAIVKGSSGTTGIPMEVRYNAESRFWREATKWRGYGWGGYRVGDKALHFWGRLAVRPGRFGKLKVDVDHALMFSVLFVNLLDYARQFQAVQKLDGQLVVRVVPRSGTTFAPAAEKLSREFVARYMPGTPFVIEVVDDIPLTAAGKRRLVVVEKPAAG